mmetsp:Transcript_11081/g.12838  ORF Transcript_11081/g.12838 Transcript_11081/m.12838 type:complete len:92 (-) Transcript_11081:99-374(-)
MSTNPVFQYPGTSPVPTSSPKITRMLGLGWFKSSPSVKTLLSATRAMLARHRHKPVKCNFIIETKKLINRLYIFDTTTQSCIIHLLLVVIL